MATYYDLKPSYKDSNGDIHTIPTYAVDSVLNTASTNAISNSAVATALQGLQTATGNPVTITNAAPINAQSVKVAIEAVQEGSGTPSPDNVRPIVGWDAVNVYKCGKNLLPSMPYPYEAKTLIDYGQDITLNGYTLSFVFSGSFLHETAAFLIFRTSDGSLSTSATAIKFYRKVSDNTYITANTTYTNEPIYFSSTGSITFRKIVIYNYPIFTDAKFENAQLEEGSTATTYEPYNGQTYNIQFKDGDNPLTVYGGSLDVVSGVLTVDRIKWVITPDVGQISSVSTSSCIISLTPAQYPNSYDVTVNKGISNKLKVTNFSAQYDNHIHFANTTLMAIYLSNEVGTTKQEWVDYLAQEQIEVSYLVANPITYQLTPTQVKLLLGTNNLWSDTGDVEIKYWTNNVIGQLVGLIQQSQS